MQSSVLDFSKFFLLNPVNLDPWLPEESRSEPGRQDELRRGQTSAADDQHRPEWAVRPLFVQGQGRLYFVEYWVWSVDICMGSVCCGVESLCSVTKPAASQPLSSAPQHLYPLPQQIKSQLFLYSGGLLPALSLQSLLQLNCLFYAPSWYNFQSRPSSENHFFNVSLHSWVELLWRCFPRRWYEAHTQNKSMLLFQYVSVFLCVCLIVCVFKPIPDSPVCLRGVTAPATVDWIT